MSNELALYDPKQFMELGEVFAKSGLFPDIHGAAQAVVKIMAGHEMGLSPFAAMNGLHIVKGKITMAGTSIAAQIRSSRRYDYRITENTDKVCTIEFYALTDDGKEKVGETTWTLEMAVQARLCQIKDGKAWARSSRGEALPWETFTRSMLFNRAMSEGARTYVPDVFGGPIYAEGEIGGEPEEAVPATPPPPPTPVQQETSQPADPTPTAQEVVEGELVEEGAEEQGPDQKPAEAGVSDAEPAPSSDNGAAGAVGEQAESGAAAGGGEPERAPADTIEALRERLNKKPSALLIFLRKPGHLGRAAIDKPDWSKLSAEDATKAIELLTAVAEGKHTCDATCDEGPAA